MTIKVIELTRECQYCSDTAQGRVRCGRLAHTAIGTGRNPSFRCVVHEGLRNDETVKSLMFTPIIRYIDKDVTFGLGYKP